MGIKKMCGYFFAAILLFSCKQECRVNNPPIINFNGCGDFMVYKNNIIDVDSHFHLMIKVNRSQLNLSRTYSTFQLPFNNLITAKIEQYNKPGNPYCTDAIIVDHEIINTLILASGEAHIKIAREQSECDSTYVVDVILKNAVFEDSNFYHIELDLVKFKNVIVNYIYP